MTLRSSLQAPATVGFVLITAGPALLVCLLLLESLAIGIQGVSRQLAKQASQPDRSLLAFDLEDSADDNGDVMFRVLPQGLLFVSGADILLTDRSGRTLATHQAESPVIAIDAGSEQFIVATQSTIEALDGKLRSLNRINTPVECRFIVGLNSGAYLCGTVIGSSETLLTLDASGGRERDRHALDHRWRTRPALSMQRVPGEDVIVAPMRRGFVLLRVEDDATITTRTIMRTGDEVPTLPFGLMQMPDASVRLVLSDGSLASLLLDSCFESSQSACALLDARMDTGADPFLSVFQSIDERDERIFYLRNLARGLAGTGLSQWTERSRLADCGTMCRLDMNTLDQRRESMVFGEEGDEILALEADPWSEASLWILRRTEHRRQIQVTPLPWLDGARIRSVEEVAAPNPTLLHASRGGTLSASVEIVARGVAELTRPADETVTVAEACEFWQPLRPQIAFELDRPRTVQISASAEEAGFRILVRSQAGNVCARGASEQPVVIHAPAMSGPVEILVGTEERHAEIPVSVTVETVRARTRRSTSTLLTFSTTSDADEEEAQADSRRWHGYRSTFGNPREVPAGGVVSGSALAPSAHSSCNGFFPEGPTVAVDNPDDTGLLLLEFWDLNPEERPMVLIERPDGSVRCAALRETRERDRRLVAAEVARTGTFRIRLGLDQPHVHAQVHMGVRILPPTQAVDITEDFRSDRLYPSTRVRSGSHKQFLGLVERRLERGDRVCSGWFQETPQATANFSDTRTMTFRPWPEDLPLDHVVVWIERPDGQHSCLEFNENDERVEDFWMPGEHRVFFGTRHQGEASRASVRYEYRRGSRGTISEREVSAGSLHWSLFQDSVGELPASELDGERFGHCAGYFPREAPQPLQLDNASGDLAISVSARSSLSGLALIVETPDGRVLCQQGGNSFVLDPSTFVPGEHTIRTGTRVRHEGASVRVTVRVRPPRPGRRGRTPGDTP